MKLSFRWYGEDDKVTLENIRQIPGMQSIVTAVYDVPVGEVWSRESIAKLKKQVEDAGLGFDVCDVCNKEKPFPAEWITGNNNDISPEFANYALPLMRGVPEHVFEDGVPKYLYRK